MKKVKLNLDVLTVTSFTADENAAGARGTVLGRDAVTNPTMDAQDPWSPLCAPTFDCNGAAGA